MALGWMLAGLNASAEPAAEPLLPEEDAEELIEELTEPPMDLPAPPPGYSLDTLLRLVRTDNPVVDIARARLADYEALFDRAYYAWTPTLRVDSILAPLPERRILRQCVIGTDSTGLPLTGPCPGQDIRRDERLTTDTEIGILTQTRARLTLPIYTFGRIESAQRAARAGVEVGRAGIDVARAELEFLVKKAYYGAQLAASVTEILEDGRRRIRSAKEQIERELSSESGRFTSNDLRKLAVQQTDLEVGYLETDALEELAWQSLRVAAGLPSEGRMALDTMELRPVGVEPRARESFVDLAMAGRPDIRMADAAVAAREGQVELARAEYYPNIALVGMFGYARGTTADDPPDPFANDPYNFFGWGVVIGAEWRLDVAATLASVRRAEADLARQRSERAALAQKVRLEVAEHYGLMVRFRREIEVREVGMKASRAWLVSNSLNFGLGLTDTDELLRSLVAYSKARLQFFQSIYEFNLAVARLSQTVGTEFALPPDGGSPARDE